MWAGGDRRAREGCIERRKRARGQEGAGARDARRAARGPVATTGRRLAVVASERRRQGTTRPREAGRGVGRMGKAIQAQCAGRQRKSASSQERTRPSVSIALAVTLLPSITSPSPPPRPDAFAPARSPRRCRPCLVRLGRHRAADVCRSSRSLHWPTVLCSSMPRSLAHLSLPLHRPVLWVPALALAPAHSQPPSARSSSSSTTRASLCRFRPMGPVRLYLADSSRSRCPSVSAPSFPIPWVTWHFRA